MAQKTVIKLSSMAPDMQEFALTCAQDAILSKNTEQVIEEPSHPGIILVCTVPTLGKAWHCKALHIIIYYDPFSLWSFILK
jgi:hypothetical protein